MPPASSTDCERKDFCDLHAVLGANLGHQQRIFFHREGVEVSDLAQQLVAGVTHRLDPTCTDLRSHFHAGREFRSAERTNSMFTATPYFAISRNSLRIVP